MRTDLVVELRVGVDGDHVLPQLGHAELRVAPLLLALLDRAEVQRARDLCPGRGGTRTHTRNAVEGQILHKKIYFSLIPDFPPFFLEKQEELKKERKHIVLVGSTS